MPCWCIFAVVKLFPNGLKQCAAPFHTLSFQVTMGTPMKVASVLSHITNFDNSTIITGHAPALPSCIAFMHRCAEPPLFSTSSSGLSRLFGIG